MKAIYKIVVFVIVTSMIFGSCTEDITNDLNLDNTGNEILVVEGDISNDDTNHYVKLSLVKEYASTATPPTVSGATVVITSDAGETYNLTEDSQNPGLYLAPKFKGNVGTTYTLTISNTGVKGEDGKDYYTARCIMKSPIVMDSITYEKSRFFYKNYEDDDPDSLLTEIDGDKIDWVSNYQTGDDIYLIKGWGRESGETNDDYYQWRYFKNGILETDTLDETIFVDDDMVDGNEIPGLTMWYDVSAKSGDVITVESRGVTKEYYLYIVGVMEETAWNSGPFGGPPANPHNNITNGAVGFFNVYSYDYVITTIE